MTSRRTALALCAALLAASAGCQQAPPARGFLLRYETPAAADEADAALLRTRKPAERALAALNAYLDVPAPVTVVARSCAGEGTGYDPAAHRIELCYDDLEEERELLGDDEAVAAVTTETVYHEAGHALIDALGLPVASDRAEEDAADRFAAFMLIRRARRGSAPCGPPPRSTGCRPPARGTTSTPRPPTERPPTSACCSAPPPNATPT